jgi:hypothetical protein
MMRAFFLNSDFRAKLLVPDWLRRKRGKFLVLNSNKNNGFSLFVVVDNNVTEELKTSSENSYTGKSTNLWVGVFKKWPVLRNIGEDMETYEVQELDKFTIKFTNKFCRLD